MIFAKKNITVRAYDFGCGIRYDAELGKFKTLGGETFRVVYMINPERV